MSTLSTHLTRRRFLQFAAAAAVPLALAACAAPAAPPPGRGEAAAPARAKVAHRDNAMDYDSRMQADTQAVFDAFNASQDKIDAKLEIAKWSEGRTLILTQISAGQPPDIFNQGGIGVLEFEAADELEPLDDLMGAEFLANFSPSGINAMSIGGKLYGMPYFLDPRGLYYRADLFEEKGLKAPETWADVREAAKALHNPPNMFGFGMGVGGPSGRSDYWWYAWVGGIGGDGNLSRWAEDGKSLVANENGIKAVQFIVDLVLNDQTTNPSPVNTGRDEDLQPLFLAGQLAMVETGSWLPTIMLNDAPDIKFELAPLPVADAGMTHANAFWPDAVMMAKQSQHKPETAELLKFMFNKENRLAFAKQRGVIPERIDVGEDPAYLDPADPVSKYNAIFVQELAHAHNVFETPWPASGEADDMDVINGVAKVLLGEASVEDAMAEAAALIDARHGV